VSNTTASRKMTDDIQPDSSRYYRNTKHNEFSNVVFHAGVKFVSGEYDFPDMLDAIFYCGRLTTNVHSQIPG